MTTAPSYSDFTLRLERHTDEGGVRVHLLESPVGSVDLVPPSALELPFAGGRLADLLDRLQEAVPASSGGPSAMLDSELLELGEALFDGLFRGAIRQNLETAFVAIEARPDVGLRLRLVMDPVDAGLAERLPWELLYRASRRRFLNRRIETPVIRQLALDRVNLAPVAITRLRALVVLSDPTGTLDLAEERQILERAWKDQSEIEPSFLERPKLSELRDHIRRAPCDVVHFVGHGERSGDQGAILLEDEHGQALPVAGTTLAEYLSSTHAVRLVVLNACETAQAPEAGAGHDPYRGVAHALMMGGISAVVAMQFQITDQAALAFCAAFYGALAHGDRSRPRWLKAVSPLAGRLEAGSG